MQLYNRMCVNFTGSEKAKASEEEELVMKRELPWVTVAEELTQGHNTVRVPDFHHAEAKQRKKAVGLLCVAFLSEILQVIRG